MENNFSWPLLFQTKIRQFWNLIVLLRKRTEKNHTWCLVATFIHWMEACALYFAFPFKWFTISFLCAAQTFHQIWFTIILPFGRDNVLCPITTFLSQIKKVESSTIFPLGCFEAMTRKLNCTLLGFQFQVHTVQIRILIEWDVKLNSQNQQRSCHSSPQWYITFVITTLMNAMYSKVQVSFIASVNIW